MNVKDTLKLLSSRINSLEQCCIQRMNSLEMTSFRNFQLISHLTSQSSGNPVYQSFHPPLPFTVSPPSNLEYHSSLPPLLFTTPPPTNSPRYPSVSPIPFSTSSSSTSEMSSEMSSNISADDTCANQHSTSTKNDCDSLPATDKSTEVPKHPPKRLSKLELLLANKENDPLPPINKKKLVDPKVVLDQNEKLQKLSKIPTLAIKLAREAFFGKEIMARCTVRGTGTYHALPQDTLEEMRQFIFRLSFPRHLTSRIEFEDVWRKCVESVGQACKALRNNKV